MQTLIIAATWASIILTVASMAVWYALRLQTTTTARGRTAPAVRRQPAVMHAEPAQLAH
jgi:hypothetical protein